MNRLLNLARRRQGDVALILFLAAGLFGAYSQARLPARHGGEMWNLAYSLADHGTFADPYFSLMTGPTACNPPLAPFITAGLIRLLRVPFLIYLASALLSILANALSAALLPRLSSVFFGNPIPGVLAAILWLFTMEIIPGWDTNYTAAALIAFACVTASIFGHEARRPKAASVAAGVLAGALCLLNPASLLVWLPWLGYMLAKAGIRNRQAWATCATVVAIAFASVAGWCARNERAIGAFVIRTSLGIELNVSNNDCAQPTTLEEEMNGCLRRYHPGGDLQEAQEFVRLGEVQYNHARLAQAESWIRSHRGRFTELSWARFVGFWFPPAVSIPSGFAFPEDFGTPGYMRKWVAWEHRTAYAIWIATALSCLGIALMIYRRVPATWFVVTSQGLYPLMYYITIGDLRYRDPVLWISLLPAGYFLAWMIRRCFEVKTTAAELVSSL